MWWRAGGAAVCGLCLALALAAGTGGGTEAGTPGHAEHVVVVSVDGLRPEFYLDPSWPAPVLRGMARDGFHAEAVTSVFPSSTYPAHATVVTGARPGRHGIPYNAPFEPEGQTGRWYWEYDSLRATTLWEVVEASGGSTASLSWPVTVGAPIRWNVPEVWAPGAYDDRLEVIRRHTTPAGFLEELEREATGRLQPHEKVAPGGSLDQAAWDIRTADMAAYVLARYRPSLLTVHLVRVDGTQHDHGRDGPAVHRAVAAADRAIGQMVEAAERAGILEETAFVVVGDHGFMEASVVLAPNVWLAEAGLLEPRPDRGAWRAAFHTAGGSAFLHLRDGTDPGALARVDEVLRGLEPDVRRRFRVLDRDDLSVLGSAPDAAAALVARPGAYFTWEASGPAVRAEERTGHGHLPTLHPHIRTGLVAWGAGVPAGTGVGHARLEDVAPLVASLLGVELSAPDGALPGPFRR